MYNLLIIYINKKINFYISNIIKTYINDVKYRIEYYKLLKDYRKLIKNIRK